VIRYLTQLANKPWEGLVVATETEVQPSTSQWGQTVEDQVDKRETTPIRDVPIEGDTGFYDKAGTILDDTYDVPFDPAMIEADRERARARGNANGRAQPEVLPSHVEDQTQSLVLAPSLANRTDYQARDLAQIEMLGTDEPSRYNAAVANNKIENGIVDGYLDTVEGTVAAEAQRQWQAGYLSKDPNLKYLETDSPQERQDRLVSLVSRMDAAKMTSKTFQATRLLLAGGGNLPSSDIESIVGTSFSYDEVALMQENAIKSKQAETRQIRNDLVRGYATEMNKDGVMGWIGQHMTPIYAWASKQWFLGQVMDELSMEDGPDFWIGESSKALRERFSDMSPDVLQAEILNLNTMVDELNKNPVFYVIANNHNVKEQFERILIDPVLNGEATDQDWDRFWGNLETAVEALTLGVGVAKLGMRSVRGIYGAMDTSTVARTSREVGNREFQTALEQNVGGRLAEDLGVDPGMATTSTKLARPEEFIDERTIHMPGVDQATSRADALEGEILKAHRGKLSRILTTEEKVGVVKGEMDKLQLGDHARMAPAMSTIDDVGDGAMINAVLTKTGTAGWNSFDELLPELLHLDPQLENLTILRRNNEGVLVPVEMDAEGLARVVTMDLKNMTDAQIISRSADLDKGSIEFLMLEREAAKRAGDIRSVDAILGDEFFLQHQQFRAWHVTDKVGFGADTVRHTMMPDWFLTPNARFGDNLVGSFLENYNIQERVTRLFDTMYKPYYSLGVKNKRKVNSMFEWSEDWAKEHGRAPDLIDFHAEFGDIPQKQMEGLIALRRGMDTQYEVFNRRLFLEMKGQGFKTGKSIDPELPRFHGKALDDTELKGVKTVYDPVTRKSVTVNASDLQGIYGDGGVIMKLDVPIDVPGSGGKVQSSLVILDGNNYKVGSLSHNPLEYYPGYSYRFYDDPYFVNKIESGVVIDGATKAGKEAVETAFKTAGSALEAERYLARIANRLVDSAGTARWVDKKDPSIIYNFERGRDINQTNRTFREKQSLNREGRLFWDHRNRERLLDVDGNQSEIMDFTKATERGTALAARQNMEEDIMRTVKNAFDGEYKGILKELESVVVDKTDMGAIIKGLGRLLNKTEDLDKQEQIKKAIKIGKYIRQMEGVDSAVIPYMRRQVLRSAQWMERITGGTRGTKWLEKHAGNIDPSRVMRAIPFTLFMIFRPARQALLQMSQPLFLAGIDPVYVLSGKGLVDSQALKRGFVKLYDEGFNDGFSTAWAAKRMGLSQKEYRKLVKELDRSGVVDVVNVNSFAGGTRKFNKVALPKEGSPTSAALYGVKVGSSAVVDTLKKVGFDFGETYNKLGTFNLAWRRHLKRKGYKSLLDMTDSDWRQVRLDTENLSLAMTRPNNAAYQTGMISVSTQFLAFSHRVALTLMGQNPALSAREVGQIYASGLMLYGANMFGGRDLVEGHLNGMNLGQYAHEEIPGVGGTLVDLLSAGLVQNVVNNMFSQAFDDWQDLDLENIAPVLNLTQFYDMQLTSAYKAPIKTMFGPFGNRFSGLMDALEFGSNLQEGLGELPAADKFMMIADMIGMELLPQYDDIQMAKLGWELNKLYSETGESTQLEPTLQSLLARGIFGVRTMDELYSMNMNRETQNEDKQVRSMIRANQRFLKQYLQLYNKGKIDRKTFMDVSRIVGHMSALAPEGRKIEVIEGSMLENLDGNDPTDTPHQQLLRLIEAQKLDKGQVLVYVRRLIKDPQEQKDVIAWVNDLYSDPSPEKIRQYLIENNPAQRDQ